MNDFSQVERDGEQLVVKVHQNYEAKMHARGDLSKWMAVCSSFGDFKIKLSH